MIRKSSLWMNEYSNCNLNIIIGRCFLTKYAKPIPPIFKNPLTFEIIRFLSSWFFVFWFNWIWLCFALLFLLSMDFYMVLDLQIVCKFVVNFWIFFTLSRIKHEVELDFKIYFLVCTLLHNLMFEIPYYVIVYVSAVSTLSTTIIPKMFLAFNRPMISMHLDRFQHLGRVQYHLVPSQQLGGNLESEWKESNFNNFTYLLIE